MDEEDVEICMFLLVILLALQEKRSRRRRRYWVHPYLQKRFEHGRYYADVSLLIILHKYIRKLMMGRPSVSRHGSIPGNISRKFSYEQGYI